MSFPMSTWIKRNCPWVVSFYRRLRYSSLAKRPPEDVFTEIYRENKWGDKDSYSGSGSNLTQTESIRNALPAIVRDFHCQTMLDVPCGDFFWMKTLDLPLQYIGADIVEELVRKNQERFGSERRSFLHLDLTQSDLPKVDLILCRDCLVHLSYSDILRAIRNMRRSGSKYLLTTSFIHVDRNDDIPTGAWRPINLQKTPFEFPNPIQWVDEKCPIPGYEDKHLGLWEISELPVS